MPLPETNLPTCVVLTLSAAKALSCYTVHPLTVAKAPTQFTLDGSNDGETWTELDWRTSEIWTANTARAFPVTSDTAYLHYRLRATDSDAGTLLIDSVSLFERIPSVNGHGEAESDAGCASALILATQAAEADAQADLDAHCRALHTKTASVSLPCPLGLGTATGDGSGASFESEADALQQAQDEASAKAQAALAQCSSGNNEVGITIPTQGVATPYPSVKSVQGVTGSITKVVLKLFLMSHQSPDDIQILLVSPTGTKVKVWQNAGGSLPGFAFININFDDAAGGPIADAAAPISTAYQPSIYPNPVLPTQMFAPAPALPYQTTMAAFIGEDPNGLWALYVMDDTVLYSGSIAGGWDLEITTA